jgi:uncharacterized RDD family membrane protein YckC
MTAPLDTYVAIETPEHIVFHHRVAGPARRLAAYLLDLLLCYSTFALVVLIALVASVGAGEVVGAAQSAMGAAVGVILVLLFAIQWAYFAALEGWRGTTPGKTALGLRVVTTMGQPIGFREAAIRNVLRAADAIPLSYSAGLLSIAGLVSMAATRRFQRLGDLVASTMVVAADRAKATAAIVLIPPARPEELSSLPENVELDALELVAIEMFLRRRERLGRERELELATMIAPLVRARYAGLAALDPSRALALLYDRANSAGRAKAGPATLGAGA